MTTTEAKGLIDRLSKATGFDRLTIQGTLASLAQAKWLTGVYANGYPVGSVAPLVERPAVPEASSIMPWVSALKTTGLDDDEIAHLLPLHSAVGDFSDADRVNLVKGLIRLRDDQSSLQGKPAFLVSADYLLGSSKLLDSLHPKALQAFGIKRNLFSGAPPVILVAGPVHPGNVVLVENPHAFWRAVGTTAIEKTAFVVTFGYGLSRHGDDYGSQLATLLENNITLQTAVCYGAPPAIQDLLNHETISFWGDLDVEGLRIFLRLQKAIPKITLSALYKPMLEALDDPTRSHGYVQAAAKHKQVKIKVADGNCNEGVLGLFAACCERAVDQEAVTSEDIVRYGQGCLSNAHVKSHLFRAGI